MELLDKQGATNYDLRRELDNSQTEAQRIKTELAQSRALMADIVYAISEKINLPTVRIEATQQTDG